MEYTTNNSLGEESGHFITDTQLRWNMKQTFYAAIFVSMIYEGRGQHVG